MPRKAELVIFWTMFAALMVATMQNESMRIDMRKDIDKVIDINSYEKSVFWKVDRDVKELQRVLSQDFHVVITPEVGDHNHIGMFGGVKR